MKAHSQTSLSPARLDAVLKVHNLLHPFLGKLIVARAAVAAFGEVALRSQTHVGKTPVSKPLDWASMMDAVASLIPDDEAFEDAIAAVETVMESALSSAAAPADAVGSAPASQRRSQIAERESAEVRVA